MLFTESLPKLDPLRSAITHAYRIDETTCVEQLITAATLPAATLTRINDIAQRLVLEVRQRRLQQGGLDAFLYEYDLSSTEGIALMCLAEALLRIPDAATIDNLLRDKITSADWAAHSGQSDSFFVNAATWGLLLTGKILAEPETTSGRMRNAVKQLIERSSAPVLRNATKQAMGLLGQQFVMGETIEEALRHAKSKEKQGYLFSYDMLGEAACTADDAERYFQAYQQAINKIGQAAKNKGVFAGPGISVKLSALHPRYEFAQRQRAIPEVTFRLRTLALQAKAENIGLTVDAEEAERLDLSLDIIAAVFCDPALADWQGFGLAVQSYQKRAPYVIDWLIKLAQQQQKRWMLRLIKGAYWDAEIKLAQVKGLAGYPVFTRKLATDVSYIACAKKILQHPEAFYAQFATHNAYSLAAVLEMANGRTDFEFQCLHGMGYTLYDQIVGADKMNIPCRVYAPVGGHKELLAYLVRRLLENGANTSFVNRIIDAELPVAEIIADPVAKLRQLRDKPHPHIPLPAAIFAPERKNSSGNDLTNTAELLALEQAMRAACKTPWFAAPLIAGKEINHHPQAVFDPSDRRHQLGEVSAASIDDVDAALQHASQATFTWDAQAVTERAACLERAADLLQQRMPEFMAMAVYEAGKTVADAIGEVREAIDFCRYYAVRACEDLVAKELVGPTGESNRLELHGRGVMVCISPWNFPLAIFIGQISAALVAGNTVIAKPAEQTPLIAAAAVRLFHEAGIPPTVLQLLPGSGEIVGARLVNDPRVNGVLFTGSTETAHAINQTLANRSGPIASLLAETGGLNAMLVDSSALLEQVVVDVISSAFNSAGQRCSALRVLFLQEEIAPRFLKMLCGAMAELTIGKPELLSTDIGPVIDEEARQMLLAHVKQMRTQGKLLYQMPLSKECEHGTFFAPCVFEIASLDRLAREVFGPILHVVRYSSQQLDEVITAINNTGYGLTFGIQSRINQTIDYVCQRVRVGNIYVNRNIIGAVVGVQPFGGEGLSGTGPKAGGSHFLPRLCTERAVCINTTAAGGNASLLCLQE